MQMQFVLEFLFSWDWVYVAGVDDGEEMKRIARGMIAAGAIDHPSLHMGSDFLALRAVNRRTRYVYLTPDQQFLQQYSSLKDEWLWSMRDFRHLVHSYFVGTCVAGCPVLGAYLETMTREAARREALQILAIRNRRRNRLPHSLVVRAYLLTLRSEAACRLRAIMEADP